MRRIPKVRSLRLGPRERQLHNVSHRMSASSSADQLNPFRIPPQITRKKTPRITRNHSARISPLVNENTSVNIRTIQMQPRPTMIHRRAWRVGALKMTQSRQTRLPVPFRPTRRCLGISQVSAVQTARLPPSTSTMGIYIEDLWIAAPGGLPRKIPNHPGKYRVGMQSSHNDLRIGRRNYDCTTYQACDRVMKRDPCLGFLV